MFLENCVYYCGHCGRRLRKTYGKSTYLSCQTPSYLPETDCRAIRWTLPEIEEIVLEVYKDQLYLLKDIREKYFSKSSDQEPILLKQIEKLTCQIKTIEAYKIQLYTDYRMGVLSKENFICKKMEQTTQIEQLEEQLNASKDALHKYQLDQEALQNRRERIDSFISEEDIPKHQLISRMYYSIDKVKIYKNRSIQITWKFQDIFSDYSIFENTSFLSCCSKL